jgi:hypothetical protein
MKNLSRGLATMSDEARDGDAALLDDGAHRRAVERHGKGRRRGR